VLVDSRGTLKLADFGIARVIARNATLTRTGVTMGTWAYMPPEQRNSAKSVDGRADIYALGASIYYLVTGKEPFDLHNTESYREAYAGFPEILAPVVQKATRFNPDDRYPDCPAMREALQAIRDQAGDVPLFAAPAPMTVRLSATTHGAEGTLVPVNLPWGGETGEGTVADGVAPVESPMGFHTDEVMAAGTRPVLSRTAPQPARTLPSPGHTVPSPSQTIAIPDFLPEDIEEIEIPRAPSAQTEIRVAGRRPRTSLLVGAGLVALLAIATQFVGQAGQAPASPATMSPPPQPTLTETAPPEAEPEVVEKPKTTSKPRTARPTTTEPVTEPAETRIAPKVPKATTPSLPPPEAGPKTSPLKVNSMPYGGTVFVDGKELGKVKKAYPLTLGAHTVEIVMPDGRRKSIEVDVTDKKENYLCWDFDNGAPC
jgi:serine/threonine-protein kinase